MALDPNVIEDALVLCLMLAITAKEDDEADAALALATQYAAGMDKTTVTFCYYRAREQLGVL